MKNPKIFIINFFIFIFTINSYVYAYDQEPKTFKQWFTGPIFTPTPITMPPSHPALEVSVMGMNTYGQYADNWRIVNVPDMWSLIEFIDFQVGFNSIFGAELIASHISNFRKNVNSNRLQDTILRFGIQILNQRKGSLVPDLRILIQETLPTGSYKKLNPNKLGTDITGLGSYQTGLYFAFQKSFKINDKHKAQLRWSLGYFFPSPVHVKGFNSYGGGIKTNGTVYPGSYASIYFSGEFSLNKRWALSFDSNYQHNLNGRFSGKKGFTNIGTPAQINVPQSVQFSIAPELEHTFSENTGIILGTWFTVFGKNSPSFAAIFVSLLHGF